MFVLMEDRKGVDLYGKRFEEVLGRLCLGSEIRIFYMKIIYWLWKKKMFKKRKIGN